jgi:lycopene cyclase domain-containing protein
MTYFGFLFRFLFLPILVLFGITWCDNRKIRPAPGFDSKRVSLGIAIHILLALAYTTPWDNYLVATGVWSYNSALVTGILLGYVPLEEYTFFVAETLLAGLWWWFLARRLTPPEKVFKPAFTVRWVTFGVLFAIWAIFSYLFFFGGESWNYLGIIFFWALPAIFPQLLFGADLLWYYRKLVFWTIVPLGTYLSLIDVVALSSSTWSISGSQTTGVLLFGILPLEEVVFFFITNVLIGFGMTLMLSNHGRDRIQNWKPGTPNVHSDT